MTYITNEQKAKNNATKDEAQYKHYRAIANSEGHRDNSHKGVSRGSVNGNG